MSQSLPEDEFVQEEPYEGEADDTPRHKEGMQDDVVDE